MLLRAESISKSFGSNTVLKSADIRVNEGARTGIVGRNGAGKTTLLKILMKEMRPDTGSVALRTDRIGYLPQFPVVNDNLTVAQTVGRPYGRLAMIENRMAEIEALMSNPHPDMDFTTLSQEYAELQEEYGSSGGYSVSSRSLAALEKVGLKGEILDRKVSQLSGGEMTKVMLARVLVQAEEADILFLDEPTSHLDMDTVEWLEDYLLGFRGALVVVSHDRYFLDNVVTEIVEIENAEMKHYTGTFSEYMEKKRTYLEQMQKLYERNEAERKRQLRIAREQHARSPYSSTHKTRMKMVERMEKVDRPEDEKNVNIRMSAARKSSRDVLLLKDLHVVRGDFPVLKGVNLELNVGDRLGIFGPNGAGKSTLIKAIMSQIPHSGHLWVAPGAKVGYFSQDHDILNEQLTAEEQLLTVMTDDRLGVRRLLARFLLTGDAVERPISTLSGGERARVALAYLIAEQHNLLIMDEPTNYLDLLSREAVESALNDYPGTLLLVTHDRYLLDAVCNRVGELRDGNLKLFAGNYTAMKGQKTPTVVEEAVVYKVVSSFKNWSTGQKYRPGEQITISESEMATFEWALKNGKLKKMRAGERKKVKKGG